MSRFVRLGSGLVLALAVLSLTTDLRGAATPRAVWSVAFVVLAAIGVRLARGLRRRSPGPPTVRWHRPSLPVTRVRRHRELVLLCERRIGRPVDEASQFCVQTPSGARTHALAVGAGYVWWLELHPRRGTVGPVLLYRPLDGVATHSEPRRRGRQRLELSWPASGELFVGVLHGPGADRLAGQLAAEQFARAPAHGEGR